MHVSRLANLIVIAAMNKIGTGSGLSFYDFDESLHSLIRISNALERLFREFRNKANKIGAFPNEESFSAIFFLVSRRDHAKYDRLNKHGE